MPDQEAIENQLQLLAAHRQTLMQYLKQQSMIGMVYIQPGVAQGIRESRANIRRIKGILRSWGVNVDDWPDDEELLGEALIQPIIVPVPSTSSIWLLYWPMLIAIVALALFIIAAFFSSSIGVSNVPSTAAVTASNLMIPSAINAISATINVLPTSEPIPTPSPIPIVAPSPTPTETPTTVPTAVPTPTPTETPTDVFVLAPTITPHSVEEHIQFQEGECTARKEVYLAPGFSAIYKLYVIAGQDIIVNTTINSAISIRDSNENQLAYSEGNQAIAHIWRDDYYYVVIFGDGNFEVKILIPPLNSGLSNC